MSLEDNFSIIPSTGVFGPAWPSNLNLPQGVAGGLSTAGWTADNILSDNFGNEGFVQQTFLGASVTSFDLSAGFGDTSSNLTVQLVNDEFNTSDGLGLGRGDDVYHNGSSDTFRPPVVGSPVFFKFGKNPATVEQAFRQTFDNIYGIQTLPPRSNPKNAWGQFFPQKPFNSDEFQSLPQHHFVDLLGQVVEDRSALWDVDTPWRGRNHFVFGGILQSYSQNKSSNGVNFTVTVNDPREILSSVDILLNNYQGSVFNHKNLINVYGFLEYDPSDSLIKEFQEKKIEAGVVSKFVNSQGIVDYTGLVSEWNDGAGWETVKPVSVSPVLKDQYSFSSNRFPPLFPITGQGFSRRTDKGIPWYRVSQALSSILEYFGPLPQEYVQAGFGGRINFRGYNYVVDFSGIPTEKIPLLYYLDFDKLDMLSLAQELCEIISHELYVSLLPVINHPSCKFLYDYNVSQIALGNTQNIVAGIIRLDAIDKTVQPRYGAIKAYLDSLSQKGILVENQDVGFELSNVTTGKFVVGGQEIDMYAFSTERDRDDLWTSTKENDPINLKELQQSQWYLETQENQQVLPYYGKLGKEAVSIPRGFGSYQQILLDATQLNAYGVGNYYVATELELRAALASYDAWKDFLLSYNDVYIEDISETSTTLDAMSFDNEESNKVLQEFYARNFGMPEDVKLNIQSTMTGSNFAVTVPRCVWDSDKPYVTEDGYPASPCSPPFGYPLYYKRATRIGIVEAGIANILSFRSRLVSDLEDLKKNYENNNSPLLSLNRQSMESRLSGLVLRLNEMKNNKEQDTENYKLLLSEIAKSTSLLKNFEEIARQIASTGGKIAEIETFFDINNSDNAMFLFNIDKTARRHNENAKKVYEFVRKVADECLGKKFLVRIPKSCNVDYEHNIKMFDPELKFNINKGPFGFSPRPINESSSFLPPLDSQGTSRYSLHYHYLSSTSKSQYTSGALKGNYNPFTEKWEWNYKPEPQGGFYSSSLFETNLTALDYFAGKIPYSALPLAMRQGLLPIDSNKLISESNRLSCYVKYNNSHFLDFTGTSSDDIIQQTITEAGQFIPDVVEDLFNYNIDAQVNHNIIQQRNADQNLVELRKPSVAFVKCSLDEKFYMPPKLKKRSTRVWACKYDLVFSIPEITVDQIIDQNGCLVQQTARPRGRAVFSVPTNGGPGKSVQWTDFNRRFDENTESWIIDGLAADLDSEHVYALITLPGRIKSTADIRWRDGPAQAYKTVEKKHLMCQDVVKITEFSEPALPDGERRFAIKCLTENGKIPKYRYSQTEQSKDARDLAEDHAQRLGFGRNAWINSSDGDIGWSPGSPANWLSVDLGQVSRGMEIAKQVSQGFSLAQPQIKLGYTSPSPVFPDIVVLPLMSMERCYGPWLSTGDVGGKVEFIKNEDLSPWNYAGYKLLNEAASLQTQFPSNLLSSERGGFVIPDAPTGIALASALKDEGPLVTSINVSVDQSNGAKTTVKLDLYTPKFGKLQKQKEEAIGKIARERQKLLDQKNAALRRGLGKSQTSSDLVTTVMSNGGNKILEMATAITQQITTNAALAKSPEQSYLLWDDEGRSTMMTLSEIQNKLSSASSPDIDSLGKYTAFGVSDMWQPYGVAANGNVRELPSEIMNKILGQ